MTISHTQNLEAHYITTDKTKRPERMVAYPPENIPKTYLFDDKDANNRLKAINQDIYNDYKKEENRKKKNFIKFLSIFTISTLLILSLKNLKFWKK